MLIEIALVSSGTFLIGALIGGISGVSYIKSASIDKKPLVKNDYPIDIDELIKRIELGYFEYNELNGDQIRLKSNKFNFAILRKGWSFTKDPQRSDAYGYVNNNAWYESGKNFGYFIIKQSDIDKILSAKNASIKSKHDQIFEELDIDNGKKLAEILDGNK